MKPSFASAIRQAVTIKDNKAFFKVLISSLEPSDTKVYMHLHTNEERGGGEGQGGRERARERETEKGRAVGARAPEYECRGDPHFQGLLIFVHLYAW